MFEKLLHQILKIPYRLNLESIKVSSDSVANVIFIHGIASSTGMWREAEEQISGNFNLFAVDLLGHGKSPKPTWNGVQSLENQAKALKKTLSKIVKQHKKPIFLVGHSMGSLVAAEFAGKFPDFAEGIFLLSPPIYLPDEVKSGIQERILKKSYNRIYANPERSLEFVNGVIDRGIVAVEKFERQEDFWPIRKSLRDAILRQNTFEVLSKIKTPTRIIYGIFDPVVIGANIRRLGRMNKNISTKRVLASHDPTIEMMKEISKSIHKKLKEKQ